LPVSEYFLAFASFSPRITDLPTCLRANTHRQAQTGGSGFPKNTHSAAVSGKPSVAERLYRQNDMLFFLTVFSLST